MAKEIASGNGFKPDQVQNVVNRIMSLKGDIRSVKAANAKRCREIMEDVAEIFDEAKSNGIPKKELKRAIKAVELTQELAALRDELEADEQETFDQLAHALGPLGEAARAAFEAGGQ